MRNILIITFCSLLIMANIVQAQSKVCPIPCSQEQFPYFFCPSRNLECSSDPNGDGKIPAKAFLPNCIHVDQTSTDGFGNTLSGMPPVGKVQPLGKPPGLKPVVGDPPDRQEIWDEYASSEFHPCDECWFVPPWLRDYDDHSDSWDDEIEYDSCVAQWSLDSSNFLNGLTRSEIDETGLTGDEKTAVDWYFNRENSWLFIKYTTEIDTFAADSTAYAKWQVDSANVQYKTVYNDNDAQNDANIAMSQWYAACPGIMKNNCCVRVYFDQDESHFDPANYTIGSSGIELALTPVPTCSSNCPDSNSWFIRINASPQFLYASNLVNPVPNPNYPDSVASRTFYTGPTAPSVNPGFETSSFRQCIEHELGHWFGFAHTNSPADTCSNNVDTCGFPSVMGTNQLSNVNPVAVTCEDLNMFRKLYCPDDSCVQCSLPSGVSSSSNDEGNLNPQLYPNPTSGECTLVYQVAAQSFVQIGVYDMLGNPVRAISSEYEGEGQHTISLGTESLPSGNYVCRVRVGGEVSYINLVIKK